MTTAPDLPRTLPFPLASSRPPLTGPQLAAAEAAADARERDAVNRLLRAVFQVGEPKAKRHKRRGQRDGL